MANITPEEFMKTYGKGDPQKFDELMEAYQEYISVIAERCIESGKEIDYYLLNNELSFDRFMMSVWKGSSDESK